MLIVLGFVDNNCNIREEFLDYDGASNMSSARGGQSRLLAENP